MKTYQIDQKDNFSFQYEDYSYDIKFQASLKKTQISKILSKEHLRLYNAYF